MSAILRRMVLVLAVFAPLSSCAPGSEATLRGFFQDIAAGRLGEAINAFSPEIHQKFDGPELTVAVQHWQTEIQAHRGLTDISLNGGVVTYNVLALYDVTLTFGDGTTKSVQTSLICNHGRWYINTAL